MTKIVRIRTHTVGVHFGTVAQLVARNGRPIYESDLKPYGFTAPAIADARAHATEQGWAIKNDAEYGTDR